jgi:hypothetical protein
MMVRRSVRSTCHQVQEIERAMSDTCGLTLHSIQKQEREKDSEVKVNNKHKQTVESDT